MKFYGIKTFKELEKKVGEAVNKVLENSSISEKEAYLLTVFDNIIENIVVSKINDRKKKIKGLNSEGHGYINYYGEELSNGCKICLFGKGINAIRSVSECNLRCSFCYYKNTHETTPILQPEHYLVGGGKYEARLDELKIAVDKQKETVDAVTWVFKEPFMNIEKHYEPVKYIHDAGLYQWMYTNGTLCTKENLNKLAEAGLEELRFNLAATECSDSVIEMMEYAASIFPSVGIESPMYKEYYKSFLKKKKKILSSGIKFINCAELHFTPENINESMKNLDNIYIYKFGYVSPMDSRMYTYDMLELASKEKWDITVHDCSNQTKVFRGYNKKLPMGVLDYSGKDALPAQWYLLMLGKYQSKLKKYLDKP